MDVGVRELKQHLSDYLDRAERGQIITITERGRPKVMLVPLPGGGDRRRRGSPRVGSRRRQSHGQLVLLPSDFDRTNQSSTSSITIAVIDRTDDDLRRLERPPKNYFAEPDSSLAERLLNSDSVLVTSWVTFVEVRRNLARVLRGTELREAKDQFAADMESMALVAVDESVCRGAAQIGEQLGVRSLDAIQ